MTTQLFLRTMFDHHVDTIQDWMERLEQNRGHPPVWVHETRIKEYKLTMCAVRFVLLTAKWTYDARGKAEEMRPQHLDDDVWERVSELMREGSACAFPKADEVLSVAPAETSSEDKQVASGMRLRTERGAPASQTRKRDAG